MWNCRSSGSMKSIVSNGAMALFAAAAAALLVLSIPSAAAAPEWFEDLTDTIQKGFRRHVRSVGPPTFKMELIHTNDMHSRFEQTNRLSGVCTPWEAQRQMCYGGFARVATIIKQAREAARKGETPPVLVLNAGDNFQGSIYYTLFKAEIVTKFINLLQFDALSLGNHEFDDGPKGLEPFLRNVKSPVVAANVDISKSKPLEGITLPPSIVLEVGGQKVGIIGYLTPETEFLSAPGDVVIHDDIEAVKEEAKRLTEQGIKIIIALGHSGYLVDQQMAKEIPEVDLIVGAHSHTFLYNNTEDPLPDPTDTPKGMYPTIVTQKSGKKVPVVQAYAFTKYIGRLSLAFDANGEMTSIAGKPLLLDNNIPEDPVVQEELNVWKGRLKNNTNEVIGSTAVFLNSKNCRYSECNMGNAIADAYIHYRVKTLLHRNTTGWTDAPIAIINGGSIRSSINARPNNNSVTLRELLEVMPFGNNLQLVKLKGDVLIDVLEHSVSRYDPTLADNKGAFLQVSGLQITYNIQKPSGHRVERVLARCSDCDFPAYYPVKDNETYAILLSNFIADGGDGFTMIRKKGEIISLDEIDSTTVQIYFNQTSPLITEVGSRILIKNSAIVSKICIFSLLPALIVTLRRALF